MKKYLFLLGSIFVFSSCEKDKVYCGKVKEKYLMHKNNGGTHNIVFYSDSLKRNINVSVGTGTYFNTNEGETVCFSLSGYQLSE